MIITAVWLLIACMVMIPRALKPLILHKGRQQDSLALGVEEPPSGETEEDSNKNKYSAK